MLIIAGYLHVDDRPQRDRFVEGHADLVTRARRAPGCMDITISADSVDATRVNNYELWEDQDSLDAWRAISNVPHLDIQVSGGHMMKYLIEASEPPFD